MEESEGTALIQRLTEPHKASAKIHNAGLSECVGHTDHASEGMLDH